MNDRPTKVPCVLEVTWHHPLPIGLRSKWMGQFLKARVLLVVLASFIHAESCQGLLCYSLGICFAFEAELAATVHAIEYVWSFSWKQLWLESD